MYRLPWNMDPYPWLCGMEIDPFDPLGPRQQLPLGLTTSVSLSGPTMFV